MFVFVSGMIFIGLVCVVLFLIFKNKERCNKTFPPATWTTPLIGCLPMVASKNIAEEMLKLGKKLGPVVSTHLGFQKYNSSYYFVTSIIIAVSFFRHKLRFIIVNGTEAIKEAFRNPSMSGRSDILYKQVLDGKGLIWSDDVKEKRKFVFKCSRFFEFRGSFTETNIHEEITLLLSSLAKHDGNAFVVKGIFNIPTVNAVFNLLLGTKIRHDDPDFQYFISRLDMIGILPDPIMRACVLFPPLLKWVPPFLSGKEKIESFFKVGFSLVQKYLDKLSVGHVSNQPRCFADALQDKIDETSSDMSVFHSERAPIIFDLLFAAIDTTGVMLEWIVLYLSHFPQVQEKLQAEIDRILENQRFPSLSDRPNMHYTSAVIHEIFRLAPVVPYGIHNTTETTTLMGYTIEKASYVVGNYYGINMDPDLWENPKDFHPERFLDEKGNFVKPDLLFTFGYGRRSCVGEVTARDQIFLFVTRILQVFNILPEKKLKSLSGNMAVTYHCVHFKAKFVKRVIIR